jgi:hypothetical protein
LILRLFSPDAGTGSYVFQTATVGDEPASCLDLESFLTERAVLARHAHLEAIAASRPYSTRALTARS